MSPTVFTPVRNAGSAASASSPAATLPTAVTSTGSAAGWPAPRTLPASSVRRPCAALRDLSASGWLLPARWPTIAPRSVANRAAPSRTAPLTAEHTSCVLTAYGSVPPDDAAGDGVDGAAAAGGTGLLPHPAPARASPPSTATASRRRIPRLLSGAAEILDAATPWRGCKRPRSRRDDGQTRPAYAAGPRGAPRRPPPRPRRRPSP